MTAYQFVVGGIEHQLDKSLAGACSAGLARRHEHEFSGLSLNARRFRRLLRHAARCHLRSGIGAARNIGIVNRMRVPARYLLHANDCFGRGNMCQCRTGHNITDGIDSVHRGTVKLIDNYPAPVRFNSGFFKADSLNIWGYANCRKDHIRLNSLFAFRRFYCHNAFITGSVDLLYR